MIKRVNVLARVLHKWVGLIVGVQMLVWLASGLYMVIVDLDFIHGDPMVRNMHQHIEITAASPVSFTSLMARYPDAHQISLRPVMDKSHFMVTTANQRYLVAPDTGRVISPLDQKTATEIARFHFNGDAPVIRSTLIESDPPTEIQTRRLPLWRVDFADRYSTSFYVDPYSGVLVTRRHQYWRVFDFLWMLHIMDYSERTNAHNPLLKIAQALGLGFAISGLLLVFFSFFTRHKPRGGTS